VKVPVTGRGADALQKVRVPDGGAAAAGFGAGCAAVAVVVAVAAASSASNETGKSRLCMFAVWKLRWSRTTDLSVGTLNPFV
jgi:hypothetical protein